MDSIRQVDKNLLLIDTGDILSTNINPRRHAFITKAYKYLNYDIWSPGDQDFIEGKKFFFESLIPQFKHTLNTNFEIEGEQFGETSIIKQIEGISIGFTATIIPEVEKYISPFRKMSVSIDSQLTSLTPVINDLKNKCDIVILLSHSGYDNDIELAKKFPEINLIIGGHSQTLLKEPARIEDTFILQAGKGGFNVGVLKIQFKDKKIDKVENKLILLDKSIENHQIIMTIIEEYKNKVKY